ncbi:MAG TPA: DUF4159 domain-containing protein [Planctomycetota bacterium]|nr:DUF4159 domain-containing protein [Planctomycetota bacterium]
MRKRVRLLGFALLVTTVVMTLQQPVLADKSVDEIRAAIEAGVEHLIAMQQEDGSWKEPDVQHGGAGYDVGRTALATLALLHSRSPRANTAIHKGLTFIVQQWPEAKTYTAGCVQQCLYQAGVDRYRKHLSMYGWMLAKSQKVFGEQAGCFSYGLYQFPKDFDKRKNYEPPRGLLSGRGDNSNTQFGILGLAYSVKSGVQIPKIVWRRAQKYYIGAQHQDGGWDYQSDAYRMAQGQDPAARAGAQPRPSSHNMTFAGTISLYIANEMLYAGTHDQCKPPPMSKPVEKGMEWVGKNWSNGQAPYGWYALERLGILSGYSEFGGHDWYQTGADQLCGRVSGGMGGSMPDLAFGILFLSRGLEPIIINKLRRSGDWNLHWHDVSHLVEYVSDKFQYGKQWRIVSLESSVDYLLKVPILWISGHEKLFFTDEEKAKLREYVERGGTILGEACCSQKEFDESFRSLMAEFWPDSQLRELPKTHPIYNTPRPLGSFQPRIDGVAIQSNQGRLGVLYIPHGISCQWERGGTRGSPAFDVGTNIHFYVEKIASRLKTPEQIERERVPTVTTPDVPRADGGAVDEEEE